MWPVYPLCLSLYPVAPAHELAHKFAHAVAPCGDSGLPDDPEAAHLQAADELLRRHGMSLAQCEVSRVYAGFDGGNDAVLFVVCVGRDVDVFALNEALTAVQLARGLSPSAQRDVVFQA